MSRTYGQFCGLARAMEMIGERWAMLVIRDLVLGPKRLTELQAGLPRIPRSILVARLNELEDAGIVRRIVLSQLDAGVIYELTEYGSGLEDVLLRLGLWGARTLREPAAGEVYTLDAAILSLLATFRPERAPSWFAVQLRLGPGLELHAVVENGELKVAEGVFADAGLVVTATGSLRPLMAGELSAADAVASGLVLLEGDPALFDVFAGMFRIPAAPQRGSGLAVR
jgi:DNA-binding HxlR family transcriptional regulator